MTLRHLRPAIALCLVLAAAASSRAQVASNKIEGRVIDGDGKALANVKVEASESATGTRATTTDKGGRFRFVAVRPGDYKVTFNLEKYAEVVKYGNVRLSGTLTLDVKMFRTGD